MVDLFLSQPDLKLMMLLIGIISWFDLCNTHTQI